MTSLLKIQQPLLQPVPAANGERSRSVSHLECQSEPTAPRQNLARIDALIQRTENKQRLNLLCRLWWKEWFRINCERKTA